jgi:hypothetical protein
VAAHTLRTESYVKLESTDSLILMTLVGLVNQPKGFIRVLGHELHFYSRISTHGRPGRRRKLGCSS